MLRRLATAPLLFTLLMPAVAQADEPELDPRTTTPAPPASADREGSRVPWTAPRGTAVAISYENGLWGGAFSQGVRVKIPFHANWGFVARPLVLHHMSTGEQRTDVGGRLELYGASPVLLDFARVYGGGGVQVFQAVAGLPNAKPTVGGGGHFGFEFFFTRKSSFFLEVGGTSPVQGGVGAGATALAGISFYPFASPVTEQRTATR